MVDQAFESEIGIVVSDVKLQIESCNSLEELDSLRLKYFGKSGAITSLLKSMSCMDDVSKARFGSNINQVKAALQSSLKAKNIALQEKIESEKLMADSVDIGLPGRHNSFLGSIHPVMRTQIELESIFKKFGFSVESGDYNCEVETNYYNFSALNIGDYHPARAMHDTFYLKNGNLLRTHTSPVQIRILQEKKPPVRIVTPGKVYRCDSDQTHTPMFHQIEGLVIDKDCNFSKLKWLLHTVLSEFFGSNVKLRFRSSYFPFTEPSAEVDIAWPVDNSKDHKWLEVLGCGMVHPNVLKNCDIDSSIYRGYAFGGGLDRLAMLKYNITDLRSFFSGNIGFLKQFS
jgi:phenylalanyl-tRNA synthetase alpha chain